MRVPTNIAFCTHTENTAIWMITDGLQVGGEREKGGKRYAISVCSAARSATRVRTHANNAAGGGGGKSRNEEVQHASIKAVSFFFSPSKVEEE